MGLMDILNGMQNGPRGQRQPTPAGGGGKMSPMTMALLGLLAYKALKHFGAQSAVPGGAGRPAPLPPGGTINAGSPGGGLGDILGGLFGGHPSGNPAGNPGGMPAGGRPGAGLADMLPGGLGGLLGGAAAGGVLSGGLGNLLKEFQASGHGNIAQSWIGTGPNQEIAPKELADALGSDTLDALAKQTGMGRDDLLAGLSQQLPDLVNQLTPNGRLPTEEEASQMV
jgi:uncharacterized protein YidB (DUF937 family)